MVALSSDSTSVPSQGQASEKASRRDRFCFKGSFAREEGNLLPRVSMQAIPLTDRIPLLSASVLGEWVTAGRPYPFYLPGGGSLSFGGMSLVWGVNDRIIMKGVSVLLIYCTRWER